MSEPDDSPPATAAGPVRPAGLPEPSPATLRAFHRVLANTGVANVTTSFLWFALTFWAYLETRSVLATSILGGSYMLLIAVFSTVFGAIVDHLRKKQVMVLSAAITLVMFASAGLLYLIFPARVLIDWSGPWFWVFTGIILVGAVVENLRNIALSTTVTLLVPADRRDRANGLVGTVQGVAFMVTSVFSGLAIGWLGMGWTMIIALGLTAGAGTHLLTITIPEPRVVAEGGRRAVQFRGALTAIRAVPGLLALIVFATFNNLVGGVFMALMDPYGLTLFTVQWWGIVLGVTSCGFIIGGALVARFGLGAHPVRTLLLANAGVALVATLFTLREAWWLYGIGLLVFMTIMPWAEAAEQTILQRVVPFHLQGRVFGFAASVEAGAAPVSAFLIGPLAQFMIIPYLATDTGRAAFGWLLGDGRARGIALVFVIAGLIMLITVAVAFRSRPYYRLSASYAASAEQPAPA